MTQIPFPPTLAAISSASARARQSAHQNRGGTSLDATIAEDLAAYRLEDGSVRPAYSPYTPTFPQGAEIGLAKIRYHLEYHPNETHSYRPEILSFKSLSELENDGLDIDRTAAAIVMFEKKSGNQLVVGSSESDLAEQIALIGTPVNVQRQTITLCSGVSGPIAHIFASSGPAGIEIYGASDVDGLFDRLKKRYDFLDPKSDTLLNLIDQLDEKSRMSQSNFDILYVERDIRRRFDVDEHTSSEFEP